MKQYLTVTLEIQNFTFCMSFNLNRGYPGLEPNSLSAMAIKYGMKTALKQVTNRLPSEPINPEEIKGKEKQMWVELSISVQYTEFCITVIKNNCFRTNKAEIAYKERENEAAATIPDAANALIQWDNIVLCFNGI